MRVTDLDKFSLQEIWRPYQNMVFPDADRLRRPPYSLLETAALVSGDTEWSRCVLDRLRCIGVHFPSYIQHPLVDAVKEGVAMLQARKDT
jgi:hypothetical protein